MKRCILFASSLLALILLAGTTSAQTPLTLRDGAVPTGLWGYYDYQSNGMSPGWLRVDPNDPMKLFTTYMLALTGTDTTAISTSRRVGYSYSTDGGAKWSTAREIEPGFRLGFPYLQVTSDGTPIIICHGDPDGLGPGTLLYFGTPGGTAFFRANEFPRASASGRTGDQGAGVIWPAFVINPKNPNAGVYIASLSAPAGTGAASLQITSSELGVGAPWRDFGDSTTTNTSGGSYVITRSPAGKIGVATFTYGLWDFAGAYFSESTDGGANWSEPTKVFGREINGIDTLWPNENLDLAYLGEEPHIVGSGALNRLYNGQQILHWSPGTGLQTIAMADSTQGLGLLRAVAAKTQPNVDYIGYPTISAGDDGQHLVVAFMAAAQTTSGDGTPTNPGDAVTSPDGFYYFRVWGVGSSNSGQKWGDPFILQDFAGDETDSASIEYPSASEAGRMVSGQYELSLAFQARRYPGMYAFINANIDGNNTPADRGPFNPCFQYFQRASLGPEKFQSKSSSVDQKTTSYARLAVDRIFPNPISSRVSIEYSLPTVGAASLSIYNALGDQMMTLIDEESNYAGGHTKTFDLSALPAGPYQLVLTQNGKSISEPLKIVR